jgi:chain length determinant protein (polysaccharide antigen chain regulator)
MSQQSEQNHDLNHNDEIDLADLVRSLWQGKWLIIGVTFVALVLAVAYLKVTPKSYTGSLEISPLTAAQADVYTELNASQFVLIDSQLLLSQFIDEVQTYNAIESFIASYGYIEQQADETDSEFAFRIRETAYTFDLAPPRPVTNNNPATNWTLNVTTEDPDLAVLVVKDALGLVNQTVSAQLLQSFERRRDEKVRENKYAIEDIVQRKDRALARHNATIGQRLELLREQALIARALKLSNGSLSAQTFQNSSTLVTASSNNEPLYLKGYLALEKEIELIKSRKDAGVFIEEVIMLDDIKLKLLQDQTIVRAEQRLAITPIGSEDFTAVLYDMASIDYKSNRKTSLILALALVLGGMLGMFVLLIRNLLINKD